MAKSSTRARTSSRAASSFMRWPRRHSRSRGDDRHHFRWHPQQSPTPASALNPAIPAEVNRILDKALEKERDLRYQSARELRADLARLRRDSGSARSHAAVAPASAPAASRWRRWAVVAGVGLGLMGLAVAGYFAWPKPCSGDAGCAARAQSLDLRRWLADTAHLVTRRPLRCVHLGPSRQLRYLGAANRGRPRSAGHDRSRHRLAAGVVVRREHVGVSIGARRRRHFRRSRARRS